MTAPTISDLQAATPAEIDFQLSQIWEAYYRALQTPTTQRIKEQLATARKYERAGWRVPRYIDVEALRAELKALEEAARAARVVAEEPYVAEFERRGGWDRFFLVVNGDGHIHRGRNCPTCHITTRFAWLIELAGATDAEVIAQHGATACTVCLPGAPLEDKRRPAPRRKRATQ